MNHTIFEGFQAGYENNNQKSCNNGILEIKL